VGVTRDAILASRPLVRTIKAEDISATDHLLVDWFDEEFRGVFGSHPLAHRITEVKRERADHDEYEVVVVRTAGRGLDHHYKTDAEVRVMEKSGSGLD
jgi:hypothetical protein